MPDENPKLDSQTKAWQEAYSQQLVNQQTAIQGAVRNLHVNLTIANWNGELVPVFKKSIRDQLMQIIISLEDPSNAN